MSPSIGRFYICEKCNHIFNWNVTQHLPNGTARDGSRVCPRCRTEFVRKFREDDLDKILSLIPDEPEIIKENKDAIP